MDRNRGWRVIKNFDADGIPAKFAINKNGNTQFSFSSFTSGDDVAVKELADTIELARNISEM